ncbi:Hypothetical protein DHA2_154093 [Giardia duodenalis]|uniref:Uncharacterized protein n=1 Tax=Giardia intestinalis TaxID=5741 RepID=V6T7Q1_GIAIN|nr:Hypothetical protein DHA2_154093 [Giardia intestinalis]
MSMASSVWFGMWDGMISLSSPSTLCLSSFASLRCSVSCLALLHGRSQSQHVCPAGRANVFGVVSQVETHGLLSGPEGTILRSECGSGPRGSPSPQVQLCAHPRNSLGTHRPQIHKPRELFPITAVAIIATRDHPSSPDWLGIEQEFTRETSGLHLQTGPSGTPLHLVAWDVDPLQCTGSLLNMEDAQSALVFSAHRLYGTMLFLSTTHSVSQQVFRPGSSDRGAYLPQVTASWGTKWGPAILRPC